MIIDEIKSLCKHYGISFNPVFTASQMLNLLDSVAGINTKGGIRPRKTFSGLAYPNRVGTRVRLHQQNIKVPATSGKTQDENYYFWGIEEGGEG